jgi:hypothetical protein
MFLMLLQLLALLLVVYLLHNSATNVPSLSFIYSRLLSSLLD